MLTKKVLKSQSYKGQTILSVEDEIGQLSTIIVGVYQMFASVADAKRHINGQPTIYVCDYCPLYHNPIIDEYVTIFNAKC